MPRKIDPDKPLFTIGSVAEILGIQPRMLRVYEEKGLILPQRTGTNRRMYSIKDMDILAYIQYLTSIKRVNLAGVLEIQKILMKMDEDTRTKFMKEVEDEIENLSKEKKRIFVSGEDHVIKEVMSTSENDESFMEELKNIRKKRKA